MMLLDFSGRPPSPDAVKAAGFNGAVRYLAPLMSGRPNPKCATRGEIEADSAAGLLVALVWESTAGAALGGADRGRVDGQTAADQARALGAPAGAVIYAAVDFDASDQQLPVVAAYMDGFRGQVHTAGYRQGVYGSARVVGVMLRDGHCEKAWQTVAWSHGVRLQGTAGVALYQRAEQIVVDGTECDVNEVWEADWGGWNLNPPQQEELMAAKPFTVTVDHTTGRGYTATDIPFDKRLSVTACSVHEDSDNVDWLPDAVGFDPRPSPDGHVVVHVQLAKPTPIDVPVEVLVAFIA